MWYNEYTKIKKLPMLEASGSLCNRLNKAAIAKEVYTMNTTFIYALVDPRNNEVRYIGKSDNPVKRFKDGHLCDKETHPKVSWIKSLRKLGLLPVLQIIEEVSFSDWQERERYWIAYYRERGERLTNLCEGGNGGAMPPEIAARVATQNRGRRLTEEHKAKIGQSAKGHFVSEATRQRWIELNKNKSAETKAKIGAAFKGRKLTEEHKAKIREGMKGKVGHPHTEETKAILREKSKGNTSHLGHKHSEEARAKIVAANKCRFGKDLDE
jgi:hypothetical protein